MGGRTCFGDPGRLGAVCGAVAALACASPAGAQLPSAPDVDTAPVEEAITETLDGQAPAPVEEVQREPPVAPVRDQVEQAARDVTSAPGTALSQTPQSPATGSGGGTRRASPGALRLGTARNASGSAPLGGAAEGRGAERRAAARAARRAARRASRRRGDARPTRPFADDGLAGSAGTVEKLVERIPLALWIALGVLAAAAIALAGLTLLNRRRTSALRRERERLEREVGLLERALLPEVPVELGALAASVACRSYDGPAAGSDFYDAFELADGRAAALVGEVAADGPEALESSNSIRTEVRGCLEAGMSPRLALQAVGLRLGADPSGPVATAILAVHDPSEGTLAYASAGHPPLIVSGPGAHEPITAVSSPPIGLGLPTGHRETTVPLPPGSVACLHTDGLLEARADGQLLGRERLTDLLEALGDDETAETLLARVVATADQTDDDMAVVVLRVKPGLYAVPPRVELLEVAADDLDRGVAEAFLDACGLSSEAAEPVLEEARECASRSGHALIAVTFDGPRARAEVTGAPAPEAPTPA